MPNRTFHNLVNTVFFGFSGNDLHEFMDRAAKTLRHKHRQVGHDTKALMTMYYLFKDKYNTQQILNTFLLHKWLDSTWSAIQENVRKKNKGYGKKESTIQAIKRMKKELLR